ncbi:BQ2448_6752 [Microbotryum intermedium]|uniref:BQ2448_6752 protein n=1 Tax=Microbotryum intermedium TaxID=269621 RepID=A0A238FKJ5_9BASI|nr:BQ2448_6752 [Microbotryum intermedium]
MLGFKAISSPVAPIYRVVRRRVGPACSHGPPAGSGLETHVIRVVLAIAFNKLYLARWHRHKDQIPLPTSYLLAREVRSHLKFRLRRLPDGELLEQLM